MYIHLTQFLAVFAATLNSISIGMQYGWCSPTVPKLMAEDSPIPITKSEAEWLDSIYMIGGVFGLPFTFYLSNKIGRKHSISAATVIYLVSWLLIIFATSVNYIYVARYLAGLGGNISFVCMSMYIAEIAHKNIRGFLGSSVHIMVLIGILLVYIIAPLLEIYMTALVGVCFPVLQLISFSMIPESPYYLILIKEEEKARKALEFFRGFLNIDQEMSEIKESFVRQQNERGHIKDFFLVASNRKSMFIMAFLNASQNFGAISVILMNLHTIFAGVKEVLTAYQVGIIFAIVMLISSIIGSICLDSCGRKILLILSSLSTATLLLIIAVYFHLDNYNRVSEYSWIPAIAVIFYAFTFQLGIGSVPLVLNGELFPTSVKAIGMTISDVSYVGFGLLSLKLYHVLAHYYGFHIPFYIFGIWCYGEAIFTAIYIPETKGRTLEDIQLLLKGGNHEEIKIDRNQKKVKSIET